MLTMSPLNEEKFDRNQVELTYYKLFKWILEDFPTRKDLEQILNPSNLPVNITVDSSVQVKPPSFSGTAKGEGKGQVTPSYKGDQPTSESRAMVGEKEARRRAGGINTSMMMKGK